MKYYLINTSKSGARINHPEVGHKNYKNLGYNLNLSQCIWQAEDGLSMNGLDEITESKKDELLTQWKAEREEVLHEEE